jgi:phenylalanyl-tRNA synthetase beta subunit
VYPTQSSSSPVSTSLQRINDLLGSDFSKEEVADVFKRLALPYTEVNSVFTITPPFERTDLVIPEDLAEEVGRILGYDRVPATELPPIAVEPNQARYRGIEKVKDFLIERGFTEISTQSFAKKGDVYLANPLDKTKPALRKDLKENMQEALVKAKQYAPLVLAPNQKPKLFEIGTVFTKEGEKLAVETSEPVSDLPEIKDDQNYIPQKYELGAYKPFSAYPFIVRDIAFWIPAEGVDNSLLSEQYFDEVWQKEMQSSDIVIKRLFMDRFPKDGRVSMAYRLIFQSFGRTLTDDEVNGIMQKITTELTSQGYEVR